MFDNFSKRAIQIIFAARFKAGERGADAIGTDDLLFGLVLDDQGTLEKILEKSLLPTMFEVENTPVHRATSHIPLLSETAAQELLANLEQELIKSQPIALATEVPLSPSLEKLFSSAKDVQTQFRHNEIEPLHLLAAILAEESGQNVKRLQSSGITREKVLRALGAMR